jgi:hypothetical protein
MSFKNQSEHLAGVLALKEPVIIYTSVSLRNRKTNL